MNRDFVLGQLGQALATVREVVEGVGEAREGDVGGVGDLIAALDSLDQMVVVDPGTFEVGLNSIKYFCLTEANLSYILICQERVMRLAWEQFLETIVSGAALVADSGSTRPDRRRRIVADCNNVRQALQELLDTYTEVGIQTCVKQEY